MTGSLKISIITPSFNQGAFIEETILSVLNQTYKNIEYIVVDGGSTDDTLAVLDKYKDKIDIVISEKDKGQADAINKGFKLATGDMVGWLNSDDILYLDCVEKIVDLYKKNQDGAIYYHSKNDMIDENGILVKTYQHIISGRDHLLRENYNVIQQGSFYSLEMVKTVDYLDISNYYCMDLDLWLKLLNCGPIYYTIDKPHAAFRIYTGTKTDTGKEKFLKNIYYVLRKHNAKLYYPTIWHKIFIYYLKARIKKIFFS